MVQVFLTIDTECSMGGAWENPLLEPVRPERSVLGRIDSGFYGIPRIMDILEENDLRGTFFVEVLAALHDTFRAELADAYTQIGRRGHDVQLHLHPIHYFYHLRQTGGLNLAELPVHKDMIGTFPMETQQQFFLRGISLFRELVGKSPTAFRAGNFGASMSTLDALEKVGIFFDSSFNAAYRSTTCQINANGAINSPWQHGSVWQIPITNFETGIWNLRGLKQLNINAVSLLEMKSVLEQAERSGLSTVTFIAHSFSLFKTADTQFREIRPDRLVLHRFAGLCRFLRKNSARFRVVTFSDAEVPFDVGHENPFPNMGAVVPALRKTVQAVNRIYWA